VGLRFNKRITIAPGVRINLGLRGASLSVGPRGASVNIGRRGVFGNVGLPGTGISYRERLGARGGTGASFRGSGADPRISQRQERIANAYRIADAAAFRIADDGKVEVIGADGFPLAGSTLNAFWTHRGDEVKAALTGLINDVQEEIDSVLEVGDFSSILVDPGVPVPPFSEPYPEEPGMPTLPAERAGKVAPFLQRLWVRRRVVSSWKRSMPPL